jgi:hypothetical protein
LLGLNLPLHIDDRLQHFIAYGDDFGVGLEAALGDDHVGKLVGECRVFMPLQ